MLDGMNNELKSVRNGIKILSKGMLPGASLHNGRKSWSGSSTHGCRSYSKSYLWSARLP